VTDSDLIAKKLARIESALTELRTLATAEEIGRDLKTERFVEHTLQLAIQAAIDVASHVVSDQRFGEPEANRELFALLARHRWIPEALAAELALMAGFRNVLVHGYDEVDLAIVRRVYEHHLGDLEAFVAAIRARLGG
jgi:uncharacterized protein YutE (UPF0331/DUF86 family)